VGRSINGPGCLGLSVGAAAGGCYVAILERAQHWGDSGEALDSCRNSKERLDARVRYPADAIIGELPATGCQRPC